VAGDGDSRIERRDRPWSARVAEAPSLREARGRRKQPNGLCYRLLLEDYRMRRTLITSGALGALFLSALMHAAPPTGSVADAAMQGNRDAVRALLKDGADVNTALGDGMTALHYAASKHDVEMAKILLYAGANVKATTRIGGY